MDLSGKWKTIANLAGKYKYVLVIIIIGLLLMLLPENSKTSAEPDSADVEVPSESETMEERLETVLGFVQGAGEVRVLLTTLSGEEVIFQSDEQGSGDSINSSTVIISDSERNQSGLVQQRKSPIYRGAVVVCEGADKPDVRLALTEAVKNATGLRTDQISVLKMK